MSTKTFGNRKFYSLPDEYHSRDKETRAKKCEDAAKLIQYIDENVIGKETTFCGPFGKRKVVYCDYTASGRSLRFIEDFVLREVLPCYGNTHTTTSATSLQSTLFRHEARDIFRNAVNASEHDAVIFAGHGCTGAVHKLIHALQLSEPPVVFVGPCEHHSSLLPWREIGSKIVRIGESKEGFLDLHELEQQLQAHSSTGRQLLGCFSACSNITGIMADDIATTLLLHQYGALAFWDYAAAAPYVKLDMNPLLHGVDEKAVYKDAMFFSVHKFVGGVQTPGVLIAKKVLFRNDVPNGCGGGTVFFVTRDDHRYLQDVELREEGGTAAIVESVRAGLVMQLKETVGVPAIMTREEHITRMVLAHIRTIPELLLLGTTSATLQRLPIFSFMVRHPRGTFLHHNFVCTVLNDVFGIQARGGCACAGPYAQDLLGIDDGLAREYEDVLLEDCRLDRTHLRRREEHSSYEMLRPGFSRISLPFFMTDEEVAFVLEALKMVATEGWKLLPQYILNPETGEWRHRSNLVFKDRKWLGSVHYTGGKMNFIEPKTSTLETLPDDHADVLQTARNTFNKARKMAQRYPLADQCVMFDERTEKLRWFMLPSEAQDLLLGNSQNVKHCVPFDPVGYEGSRGVEEVTVNPVIMPNGMGASLPLPKVTIASDTDSRNSPLHFAVGGTVNPANLTPLFGVLDVERARSFHSLGHGNALSSPTAVSPLPSLAALAISERQRHCSCSSQTENNSLERDMGPLTINNTEMGRCSPASQSPEDLQAYVKEVTKELATEIKSEIREVITQVQDVLADSSDSGNDFLGPIERPRASSLSLRSAQDVAEYLVEASQRLAVEVKSELREVVSAVDVLIADDGEFKRSSTPPCLSAISRSNAFLSSPELIRKQFTRPRLGPASMSSPAMLSPVSPVTSPIEDYLKEVTSAGRPQALTAESKQSSECESDETVIYVASQKLEEATTPDEEAELEMDGVGVEPQIKTPPELMVGDESDENKNVKSVRPARGAVASISSQDSGINLSFQDSEPSGKVACPLLRRRNVDLEEPAPEDCVLPQVSARWHCPPKVIWKPAVEALQEFEMIRDGDRVMLCLSGGKDSLSLLHTLHQYQFYARAKGVHFTLGAATVDPGSTAYDPRPLIPYLKALDVPYLYEEQQILQKAASLAECTSVCSFCSRMKRGRLYAAARREDYNVLALGQHLDDLSESFLMSMFHNGRLRTMKAHYYIRERDLRVIRPFVYVREKALRQFAENRKLPVIPENCPACFEAPKERHRMKQLLAQQEILFPKLFWSLRSAMHPLMNVRHTGVESKLFSRHLLRQRRQSQDQSESDTEEEPIS